MMTLRPAGERGHTRFDWLDSRHTFSFGDYHDPRHMGFRALRVINDDRVAGGGGFGMHGHRDMEILTIVLAGALQHRDSLGNGSVLRPGEVQRMTAGTGIRHAEFNPSPSDAVHFFQIWLLPDRSGLAPEYEQRAIPDEQRRNRPVLVAGPDGRDGAMRIHQDARLYLTALDAGREAAIELSAGRHAWVQVLAGGATINGRSLGAGDGAAVSNESRLSLAGGSAGGELLIFDLN